MLRVDGITVRYGKIPALKGVSLEVREGELVTLIGANGAGKTTTLRAISGLLPLAEGSITFRGQPIGNVPARDILALGLAHCPEGRRVFPQLTVRENLAMGAYLRRDRAQVARDLARVLEKFPRLEERLAQPAGTLSGGEQQMLAIARALMSRPKLMLFDEPSLGLAPNFVERTFEIITEIRDEGATVLMVEQNALAALEMCDRAYLLETGQVVQHGSATDMLANPHIRAARSTVAAAMIGAGLAAACTTNPGMSQAPAPVAPSQSSQSGQPPFQAPPNPMIGGAPMYPSRDFVDNLAQSPDHHTLVAALNVAGVAATLRQPGPFTLFAPTDAAFRALPPGLLEQLMQPANQARLTALLNQHVVRGRLDSTTLGQQVAAGNGVTELTTLAGTKLSARLNGAVNLLLRDPAGSFANISIYDVMDANGVTHVIDKVLMPAQSP